MKNLLYRMGGGILLLSFAFNASAQANFPVTVSLIEETVSTEPIYTGLKLDSQKHLVFGNNYESKMKLRFTTCFTEYTTKIGGIECYNKLSFSNEKTGWISYTIFGDGSDTDSYDENTLPYTGKDEDGYLYVDFEFDVIAGGSLKVTYYCIQENVVYDWENYVHEESSPDGYTVNSTAKTHEGEKYHVVAEWNPNLYNYSTVKDFSVQLKYEEYDENTGKDVEKTTESAIMDFTNESFGEIINDEVSSYFYPHSYDNVNDRQNTGIKLHYNFMPEGIEDGDFVKCAWLYMDNEGNYVTEMSEDFNLLNYGQTIWGDEGYIEIPLYGMALLMDDATLAKYKGTDLEPEKVLHSGVQISSTHIHQAGILYEAEIPNHYSLLKLEQMNSILPKECANKTIFTFTGTDFMFLKNSITGEDETSVTVENPWKLLDNENSMYGEDYNFEKDLVYKVNDDFSYYTKWSDHSPITNIPVYMDREILTGFMGSTCLPYNLMSYQPMDGDGSYIHPIKVYKLSYYNSRSNHFYFKVVNPELVKDDGGNTLYCKPYPAFTPYMIMNNCKTGTYDLEKGKNGRYVRLYAAPEEEEDEENYQYVHSYIYKSIKNNEKVNEDGLCIEQVDEDLAMIGTLKNYTITAEDVSKYDFYAFRQTNMLSGFENMREDSWSGTYSGGEFVKLKAGQNIKPYRTFIRAKKNLVAAQSSAVFTGTDSQETTGINEITATGKVVQPAGVYTLDGRKVASVSQLHTPGALPKGIYIVNGKKVVIK